MKTKPFLALNRGLMAFFLGWGMFFPSSLQALMRKPELYLHVKFVHILTVTLFFSAALIGTIWETRALLSKDIAIMHYMFKTMIWFDAVFTSPLIFAGVLSGVMLGTITGGIWSQGWLSLAFILFLFAGVVWVVADLPMQYKLARLFSELEGNSNLSPNQLRKLFWQRMIVNILGTAPLLAVFILMIHKPDIPKVTEWFGAYMAGAVEVDH